MTTESEPPLCASRADLERLQGNRVRLLGRYDVAPIAGSKRLQPASIVLDDGTQVLRSYRPVREELRYADKRVVVTGVVTLDAGQPAMVQQVMAPHVSVERIELASGESPAEEVGEGVPIPPVVRSAEAFSRRDGRWVQVVGKLVVVEPRQGDSFWARAEISLEDGGRVVLEIVPTAKWKPHEGELVTVTSRARVQGTGLALEDLAAICRGEVARCGMRR